MKIYTTKPRPEVPASFTIYNAPRPLYGDIEWKGDFLTGIFYAAIDTDSNETAWMVSRNEDSQAAEVVYITEEAAIEAYLRNNRYADKYRQMLADERVWRRQVLHVLEMLNAGRLEL